MWQACYFMFREGRRQGKYFLIDGMSQRIEREKREKNSRPYLPPMFQENFSHFSIEIKKDFRPTSYSCSGDGEYFTMKFFISLLDFFF